MLWLIRNPVLEYRLAVLDHKHKSSKIASHRCQNSAGVFSRYQVCGDRPGFILEVWCRCFRYPVCAFIILKMVSAPVKAWTNGRVRPFCEAAIQRQHIVFSGFLPPESLKLL